MNGKQYIGQSIDFKSRKKTHLIYLRNNKHGNTHLQRSFNKYGEKSFKFEIIDSANSSKELNQLEKNYIIQAGFPNEKLCYNLMSGGGSKGICSLKTRKKMSESHKGTHTGKNNYWYGKHRSVETCEKISKANKGKKRSEKIRKKMSESQKGKNNNRYGKHHTEETSKKMSKSKNNGLPFRVYKIKVPNSLQGFCYTYGYYVNGKQKTISSKDIYQLYEKVLSKNLPWDWFNYPYRTLI